MCVKGLTLWVPLDGVRGKLADRTRACLLVSKLWQILVPIYKTCVKQRKQARLSRISLQIHHTYKLR